ncbi:MAG TPA: SpoVR family protein [Oligoflexia bacterium]|nr:SpoVR family protein [Oligoflexia bacterium]HMP27188.1 SpoVR family protein [Oligoflexia bacterium]
MSFSLEDLIQWDDKIKEVVERYRLRIYPQEFDICDHNEMIGYMAYAGMPSRYSHWSFGKGFERQRMLYQHGVAGLPYEMVINSNPCVAYLMRDNTLLLQILTIAHVYGHNDFFANNFTFKSGIDAQYTLPMFKAHATRVERYMQDPSIGLETVEDTLDHAHALAFQCSKNLAIRKVSMEEQKEELWARSQPQPDPFANIHQKKEFVAPDLNKIPIEPDEDLLEFVATHNPYLPEWKRDLLRIVASETRYFIPQMETKIMNEGWASYWHHKIMNQLDLSEDLRLEFMVRHNQVLRPIPGSINPYHLGFILWHQIEDRANKEAGLDPEEVKYEIDTPGRQMIFQVREADRDTSFLRRFLDEATVRELNLFTHERRGKERVVAQVADRQGWRDVKEQLIKNVGSGGIPVIKIEDADYKRQHILYLKHYHDGRDLQLEYAEATLRHLYKLWEREVVLETLLGGKKVLLRMIEGEKLAIEKP